MNFKHFLALFAVSMVAVGDACKTAKYELKMQTMFTTENIPMAPESAHLSPLTAFSHGRRFSAFIRYGYATAGVQNVAETGNTSTLEAELMHPLVKDVAVADGPIFGADEMFVQEVTVNCRYPFISAISMLAPSPDWFLAISSLDMRDVNGSFVERSGQLFAYDAGTDSGETFTAADKVTEPRENIAPLWGEPFYGKAVAKFYLSLKEE